MNHTRPKGLRPWLPASNRAPRLLIVRLSALGDVLHALPVLSALRKRFPEARIDWAVEDKAADLLRFRKDIDRLHVFPRRRMRAAMRRRIPRPVELGRAVAGFVGGLRSEAYDAALDLQGNLKSGAVSRASGAALRFGFDRSLVREGNQIFNQRRFVPPPGLHHRVERNLALASALIGERLQYVAPGFPTEPEHAAAAARLVAAAGLPANGFMVLHPGASGFGAFKRWPDRRFVSLATRLLDDGHAVGITHAPGEAASTERIVAGTKDRARPLPTAGFPILADVIRRAGLFVAADTGPLHLAALVDTPLLGLYGPKDPAVYGPYGVRADGTAGLLPVLTQDDVACRPCTLRKCADPLCMTTMAPERVHHVAAGLLARR